MCLLTLIGQKWSKFGQPILHDSDRSSGDIDDLFMDSCRARNNRVSISSRLAIALSDESQDTGVSNLDSL